MLPIYFRPFFRSYNPIYNDRIGAHVVVDLNKNGFTTESQHLESKNTTQKGEVETSIFI